MSKIVNFGECINRSTLSLIIKYNLKKPSMIKANYPKGQDAK